MFFISMTGFICLDQVGKIMFGLFEIDIAENKHDKRGQAGKKQEEPIDGLAAEERGTCGFDDARHWIDSEYPGIFSEDARRVNDRRDKKKYLNEKWQDIFYI